MKPLSSATVKPDLYDRANISSLFFCIGFFLTLFLAALELTVSISLVFGWHITSFHTPFSAILTVAIGYMAATRAEISYRRILTAIAYFAVLTMLALIIAALFYDRSFDGQAYHQEAILQLAANWNPFYDSLDDEIAHQIWLTHYAKGPWYQAAALYELTSLIESGKATNLIYIFISWFFVASLLFNIKHIPVWAALAMATLAALNPVSIYQSLSYYVDGQLSSVFISLSALLIAMLYRPHKLIVISAAALILLLVNIKFTGLVYTALLLFAYAIASVYINQIKKTFHQSWGLAVGFMLGLLLVGFNPYITNTLKHGHIFFPLRGENAIDVASHAKPAPLKDMNRIEALANSLFSVSSNSKKDLTLKLPFQIRNSGEIYAMSGFDTRLGGFGPWFSGPLILGGIITLIILVSAKTPLHKLSTVFLIGTLAFTVVINPEAWWARYVPQLYLIPLIACALVFICLTRKTRLLASITLLAIALNVAMVSYASTIQNIKGTLAINDQLDEFSKKGEPLSVYFSIFEATRARLNEASIKYLAVNDECSLPCKTPSILLNTNERVKICAGSTLLDNDTQGDNSPSDVD